MIVDCNSYSASFLIVKQFLERNPIKDLDTSINDIAHMSSIPVIVVCHFIQRIYGPSEELTKKIETINKFYHYSKIIDLKE